MRFITYYGLLSLHYAVMLSQNQSAFTIDHFFFYIIGYCYLSFVIYFTISPIYYYVLSIFYLSLFYILYIYIRFSSIFIEKIIFNHFYIHNLLIIAVFSNILRIICILFRLLTISRMIRFIQNAKRPERCSGRLYFLFYFMTARDPMGSQGSSAMGSCSSAASCWAVRYFFSMSTW